MSNLSLAATVTLTWTGKVPSLGCVDKPMSSNTKLKTLQTQCYNDIKIRENNKTDNTVVEFNL